MFILHLLTISKMRLKLDQIYFAIMNMGPSHLALREAGGAWGCTIPRFFFHIESRDHAIKDKTGVDLAGPEAAHWHAVKLAYQVRYYVPDDSGNWVIKIHDAVGTTVEVFVPSFRTRQLAGFK